MSKNKTFWLLTLAIASGVLIPTLVQEGMFLDGITYSAISKNLANGYGSFWKPHYTKLLYPEFYEHPPLVFILQSYFFKLFGDKFFTEGIFSLTTAILTAFAISRCWRLFSDKKEVKEYDWMPVLLWISVPLVFWSYKNNLLENSVSVFTTFSVFLIAKSLIERKLIYLFFGSLLIIMAFLCKGIVGLFPIVLPFLYMISHKKSRKHLLYGIILILFFGGILFLCLVMIPGLKDNLTNYANQQLLPALNNDREITTSNRFYILFKLFLELLFPILILVYVGIRTWLSDRQHGMFRNRNALFFLLIAVAASIPLLMTLKQRKFYLIPSIPFYILSMSFWILPYIREIYGRISELILGRIRKFSIALLCVVVIVSIFRFGKFSRDGEELKDIYAISRIVPEGSVISTTSELWSDWYLVAYMSRIGYLSLDPDKEHEYFLIKKGDKVENIELEKYDFVDLNLTKYQVLKHKD